MENQTAPAANENPNGPMLAIQSVYLKDCSYEAPKGPRVEGNWSPQISLDINTTASVVAPELNVRFDSNSKRILWAAEVWHSIKKHWVLELQRLIRARRAAL